MRLSIKWLEEFLCSSNTPQEIAEIFTQKGVSVNTIERIGSALENFVVAEVKEVKDNKIVVWDAKDFFEIKTTLSALKPKDKIGLNPKELKLLTPNLINLSNDFQPIVLEDNYEPGRPLLDYLDDYVLDLEILPNRSDLMSVRGLAYELLSYEECKVELKPVSKIFPVESDKYLIRDLLNLEVLDKSACPDYIARLIWDIKIRPSPFWLQWRLMAGGLRPINNVVDATNYIMLKYGTPLHAFDYDTVKDHTIKVRFAQKGEKIKTIDGEMRDLSESVLVIADSKRPVAIAGIIGGVDTEITHFTKRVLLECARFDAKTIRRGSKKLNLATEASQRFEMGIDSEILEQASQEASQLIAYLGNGVIIKDKLETRTPISKTQIELSVSRTNALLGLNLTDAQIKDILQRINCNVSAKDNRLMVQVPSSRLDLQQEIDLVEEVGRIYGYDKLPSVFNLRGNQIGTKDKTSQQISQIRDFLVGQGFIENYTISFCDELSAREFTESENTVVKIPNPLNERFAYLRPLILPTILSSVSNNYRRGNKNLRLFEIGKVFYYKDKSIKEDYHLTVVILGHQQPIFWSEPVSLVNYFNIKGIAESLFAFLKIEDINFAETDKKFLVSNSAVVIKYADQELGYLGEIKKSILDMFDIPVPVFALELNLERIQPLIPAMLYFQPLPRFPAVSRDFAFVVSDKILADEIVKSVKKIAGALLEQVEIFDCFKGAPLPDGMSNLGIRVTLRSQERTLSQEEVEKIFDRIVQHLQDKWSVTLRK
ncbi:MAG: phenylalanine--tRNA ligase subunit beta [candidate division WOR-3 bacterium]|nr:phenylalanine--tRNA ligase subunit beta [candidate division WOR-3 bacterium]